MSSCYGGNVIAPRLDTIDLRLLRVFAAVVEAHGFTGAQTALNIGASTISNQISTLETRLGVKLCQRGRAGFRLTEDGETIFAETQKLFGAIDGFNLRASSLRGLMQGSLAIGLLDNTISDPNAVLSDVLGHFARVMRDVQVSIEIRPPNELLRELNEGRIHVAVGSFPKILLGLTYVPLYEENHGFYCGVGHPLFAMPGQEITMDLIQRQRLISRGYWGARDIRHFQTARASATVNSMEAAARLILSGEYLGYLPDHYALPMLERGHIKPLLPQHLTYTAPFELAYGKSTRESKPAQVFVDLVLEAFKAPAEARRRPGQ